MLKFFKNSHTIIVNEMAVMGCDTAILTLESDMDKNIVEMVKSIVDQVIKL